MILKYKSADGSKFYRPVIFGRPTLASFRTRTACEKYQARFINTFVRLLPKTDHQPLTRWMRFKVWFTNLFRRER